MKCCLCDKEDNPFKYVTNVANSMQDKQLCFSCNYWQERVENKEKYLIIDGKCYVRGGENQVYKGFGGAKWTIRKDDEVFTTTNLWFNGEVPAHFRNQLPDNAEFIKELQ